LLARKWETSGPCRREVVATTRNTNRCRLSKSAGCVYVLEKWFNSVSRLSVGVVFQLYAFGASPAECGGQYGIPRSPCMREGNRPYATRTSTTPDRQPPRRDTTLNLVIGRVLRNPVGPPPYEGITYLYVRMCTLMYRENDIW